MRISYLAASALTTTAMALFTLPATAAFAGGCSDASCGATSYGSGTVSGITYGSGSYHAPSKSSVTLYNSGNSHSTHGSSMGSSTRYTGGSSSTYGSSYTTNQAPCPSGSTRSSDGFCLTNSGSSSFSSSTRYSSGASQTSSGYTPSDYTGSTNYTSSAASSVNVQPFTTTVSNISDYRVAGMGSNEFLSKTNCPTSVLGGNGAKVLGCYSVVKPVAPAPVVRPAPIVRTQTHLQNVRVVRPIIYVRYPVPTPVAVPYSVPVYGHHYQQRTACGGGMSYSRYGNHWPQAGGCGGW